jgi:hypothetical protein
MCSALRCIVGGYPHDRPGGSGVTSGPTVANALKEDALQQGIVD